MKNKRAIILLFIANSISGCAQGITMISIPWYFKEFVGDSSTFLQIFMGVTFVSMFWGLYAGTLIDKYSRKNIFLGISVYGLLISGMVGLMGLYSMGLPSWIVALVFCNTVLIYNIHYPNLYAFAQEITLPKHYNRITSYIEIQGQFTTAMAGAIAAILLTGTEGGNLSLLGMKVSTGIEIKAWSMYEIILLDAATYALAIIFILGIRYTSIKERDQSSDSIWNRMKYGWTFLRSRPLIMLFTFASYAVFITILVTGFGLLPMIIYNQLGGDAANYATSDMFFALGSLLAGILGAGFMGNVRPVKAIIFLSFLAVGVYVFVSLNQSVIAFYPAFLFLGLSNASIRIQRMNYIFKTVPNSVIGRIGSIGNIFRVFIMIVLLGVFSISFFDESNNVIYATAILSLVCLTGGLALLSKLNPLLKLSEEEVEH